MAELIFSDTTATSVKLFIPRGVPDEKMIALIAERERSTGEPTSLHALRRNQEMTLHKKKTNVRVFPLARGEKFWYNRLVIQPCGGCREGPPSRERAEGCKARRRARVPTPALRPIPAGLPPLSGASGGESPKQGGTAKRASSLHGTGLFV